MTAPTARPAASSSRPAASVVRPTSPVGTGTRSGPSEMTSTTGSPSDNAVPPIGCISSTSPSTLPSRLSKRSSTTQPNSVNRAPALSPEEPTSDGSLRVTSLVASQSAVPPTTAATTRTPAKTAAGQRRRGPTGRWSLGGSSGNTLGATDSASPARGAAPISPGPTSGSGSGRGSPSATVNSIRPNSAAVGLMSGCAAPALATTGASGPSESGTGTSRPSRARNVPATVLSTNGRWPVTASTRQRARAYTSDRPSTAWPRACSGDA